MAKETVKVKKTTDKAPKEKKVRPVFTGGPRDAAGKLTGAPEGYEPGKFQPLKKDAFASSANFMEHRADLIDFRADRMKKLAATTRERAKRLIQFGDSEVSKKVSKLQRLNDSATALIAELRGELSQEQVDAMLAELKKTISAPPTA